MKQENPVPTSTQGQSIKERFEEAIKKKAQDSQSEPVKNMEAGMTYPISEDAYGRFVGNLAASPEGILDNMTPFKINLLHAALGLASEAGEILDEVKKHVFYGAPLDRVAIHKEQGDLEWYAQLLRNTLGRSRQEVIGSNVDKLMKRHPHGFSTASALAKADETPTVHIELKEVNRELLKSAQEPQPCSEELKSNS